MGMVAGENIHKQICEWRRRGGKPSQASSQGFYDLFGMIIVSLIFFHLLLARDSLKNCTVTPKGSNLLEQTS
jgi:hypothetical protein